MKCPSCHKGVLQDVYRDHQYTESGLSNVIILGAKFEVCPECKEEMLSLPRIASLHRLIAFELAGQKGRLAGEEIRFLRKYLGWSGADFAEVFDVAAETVSRWERNHSPMGPTAERLLRLMVFREKPVEEYPNKALANVAQSDAPRLQIGIKSDKEGWHIAA